MEDLANLTVPNPVMEVSSTPMNIFNEKVGKTVTDKFSTPVKSTLPPFVFFCYLIHNLFLYLHFLRIIIFLHFFLYNFIFYFPFIFCL